MSVSEFALPEGFSPRAYLECLRNRVLRVTTGLPAGTQRLELAIEAVWVSSLEVARSTASPIPWSQVAAGGNPMRGLLDPIRLMIRSELLQSGIKQPDPVLGPLMTQILDVAQRESGLQRADYEARDLLYHWLERRLREPELVAAEAQPLDAVA